MDALARRSGRYLNIGNALYSAGKFTDATTAFQKVISNYPQSDSVAVAYYKLVEWEQSTTTVPFRERLGNLLPSWRRTREI